MTPRYLARIADLAYQTATFSEKDVQVLVHAGMDDDGPVLVIAYRGTERDGRDILRDIRFAPWRDSKIGWCHAGFLKGMRKVWPQLYADYLHDATCPIWWTGHSLGGAMAILGAAYMESTLRTPAGLVTFGAPRAGFEQVRTILAPVPTVVCYRRGKDTVTEVPHRWPLRYRHPVVDLTPIGEPLHLFLDHQMQGYIADAPEAFALAP